MSVFETPPDHQLFVRQFAGAKIKDTPNVYITGPLWRESTCDLWIPFTKGQ